MKYIWVKINAQSLHTHRCIHICFPSGQAVKNQPTMQKTQERGSIPGSGGSPGEGNGNPLQYSCLENAMDREAWQTTVHGVSKSQTRLNDWARTYTYSVGKDLVRGFPGTSAGKELPAMQETPLITGSERFPGEGIDYPLQYSWASLVAQLVKNLPAVSETRVRSWVRKILWRRKSLPSPVFWPKEFHGLYSPWSCRE